MQLYATIGQISLHYHTDVIALLNMPITALYFHFSRIKQGMEQ